MPALPHQPPDDHQVGLRELRHHTRQVIERASRGEVIDITDHGRTVARIMPAGDRELPSDVAQLVEEGRASLPEEPPYLPPLEPSDGTNRLGDIVEEQREDRA